MPELRVPPLVVHPSKRHVRGVIAGAILQAAEAERDHHLAEGHRLRARRATRRVELLHGIADGTRRPAPVLGILLRTSTRLGLLAAAALLAVDAAAFGVHSWLTGAADCAVLALAFLWFFACIDDGSRIRRKI